MHLHLLLSVLLFLVLIYFTIVTNKGEDGAGIGLLAFQVILMLQIMNKARGIFGSIGGLSSLFPQIKMSRDIENSLLISQEYSIERENFKYGGLENRLPFVLHLKGNGVITRFNYLNLLERIETLFTDPNCSTAEYLPSEKTIIITRPVVKDHFRHLDKIPNQIYPLIMQLIDHWQEVGKNIFIIDWRLLSECNVTDILAVAQTQSFYKNYSSY